MYCHYSLMKSKSVTRDLYTTICGQKYFFSAFQPIISTSASEFPPFKRLLVYIITWLAVVLGINSMSNAGSNFHEAKPSEISCITSAINP